MDKSRIYNALNAKRKEFRLLEVYAGEPKDRVKCRLSVAKLAWFSHLRYESISYSWGNPKVLSEIEIDGIRTKMPASSVAAVRRMRLPNRERVLWIDAICINQADLDERSQQVAFMKDIYSNSRGNLIYLGEEEATTEAAVRSVEAVLREARRETDNFRNFGSTVFDRATGLENTSKTGIRESFLIDTNALDKFYEAAWFK